jgi:hypothetical protein
MGFVDGVPSDRSRRTCRMAVILTPAWMGADSAAEMDAAVKYVESLDARMTPRLLPEEDALDDVDDDDDEADTTLPGDLWFLGACARMPDPASYTFRWPHSRSGGRMWTDNGKRDSREWQTCNQPRGTETPSISC